MVLDLPGVGRNLQDHIQSRLVYSARQPMRSASNGLCRNGAMLRTGRFDSAAPDVYLMMFDMPAPPATIGVDFAVPLPVTGYTIAFAHQAPPASRGSITLASADPDAPAVIDPRYYAEDDDLKAMLAYLDVARSVGEADALSPWRECEVWPGRHVDANGLRDYLRRSSGTSYHPVGTCRMGSGSLAVVGSDLRVHGIDGLRIADASVMPEIISANTNATVVASAERASEWIIGRSNEPDHRPFRQPVR